MKATTLISAFVFAHAVFAQATESASTSVSAGSVPASGSTATVSAPAESTTKSATGAKSASKSEAQSSSAAGTPTSQPAATGNPLIPSSISAGCSTFLAKLNTNKDIASCLTPLSNAVSAYSTSSGSASGLSTALDSLCATKDCSAIPSKLVEFEDACGDELTGANPNQVVKNNYDVLYSVTPFKDAICSQDANTKDYCLFSIANATKAESVTYAASHLDNSVSLRRKRAQTVLIPNYETYRSTNLMYLFASPDKDAAGLCISCTQQVLAKYFAFQEANPHALKIKNSPLLGSQGELFTEVQDKCSPEFVSALRSAANIDPSTINSNGAPSAFAGSLLTAAAGALAAVMALI